MQKPATARQLLPTTAYISDAWYTREQRELFSRSWVWVGMLEDFAEPGDYLAAQVGLYPLFVIRGRDGELRARRSTALSVARAAAKAPPTRPRSR